MGTRGFLGFVVDGQEKIAYNHFDSYPEGLGKDVLEWLHEIVRLDHDMGVSILRDTARALRVVDPQSSPSAEDIERLRPYADTNVGTKSLDDWYVLLRETQGNPRLMLAAGVIEDGSQFPLDSLFAEWGYLVDLDAEVFEMYQGFQHAKHDAGRFADRDKPRDGYYPCALVRTWPLAELPQPEEFVAAFIEDDEENERASEPMTANPFDQELLDAFNELANANASGDQARIAAAVRRADEAKRRHGEYATTT